MIRIQRLSIHCHNQTFLSLNYNLSYFARKGGERYKHCDCKKSCWTLWICRFMESNKRLMLNVEFVNQNLAQNPLNVKSRYGSSYSSTGNLNSLIPVKQHRNVVSSVFSFTETQSNVKCKKIMNRRFHDDKIDLLGAQLQLPLLSFITLLWYSNLSDESQKGYCTLRCQITQAEELLKSPNNYTLRNGDLLVIYSSSFRHGFALFRWLQQLFITKDCKWFPQ